MKCIMLKQPWAHLVATGRKTIETRTWRTRHRGPLAIAASKSWDQAGYDLLNCSSIAMPRPREHVFGAVLATVVLREVVPYRQELVMEGLFPFTAGERRFGWVLEDIKMLERPVPVKGTLGLFEVVL